MRYLARLLAVLLVVLSVGGVAHAKTHWQHYGADHAYTSKATAKADAANVFKRAGWSPKAIAAMVDEMKKSPERIELRNGNHLDFMRSGAHALWRDVDVDFIPPPGKGVNVVVSADRWTVTVDGVTYEAILPDVCNNLAGRTSKPPAPQCRIVNIETRVGEEVAIHHQYESDDECWGYREVPRLYEPDGPGAVWVKPPTTCPDGPCNFSAVNAVTRGPRMDLIGTTMVTPGFHQYRVSKKLLDLCIEYLGRGTRESSFTARVRPNADFKLAEEMMQAHVFYSSAELPKDVKMNAPFGLFSWASSQEVADRINRKYATVIASAN